MAISISSFLPNDPRGIAHDIHLDERGNLVIARGIEDIRQRVVERLRFYHGEWIFATSQGVPYRREIFRRNVSVGLAAAVVSDAIRSVDGVVSVSDVRSDLDDRSRVMSYSARVATSEGVFSLEEQIG